MRTPLPTKQVRRSDLHIIRTGFGAWANHHETTVSAVAIAWVLPFTLAA